MIVVVVDVMDMRVRAEVMMVMILVCRYEVTKVVMIIVIGAILLGIVASLMEVTMLDLIKVVHVHVQTEIQVKVLILDLDLAKM